MLLVAARAETGGCRIEYPYRVAARVPTSSKRMEAGTVHRSAPPCIVLAADKRVQISQRRSRTKDLSRRQPSAAPLRGIWQCEQVQASEKLQGEHEHRQEAQPVRILVLRYGNAVDDDDRREGNRQPAMCQPNPFVPVQWNLL
jgi:hypothetical protein